MNIVFLLPVLLIASINFIINIIQNSSNRIASYLRCVLEPEICGYNWETNLHYFRINSNRKHHFTFVKSILIAPISLSTICFAIYIMTLEKLLVVPTIFTAFILVIFIISIFVLQKTRRDTTMKNYDKLWKNAVKLKSNKRNDFKANNNG